MRRNRERISYELDTTNLHSGITENSDDLFQVTMIYPVRIQIIKNADMNLKILGKYLVTTPENKIDEVKSTCKFILYLCYLIRSFAMEKEMKQSQPGTNTNIETIIIKTFCAVFAFFVSKFETLH